MKAQRNLILTELHEQAIKKKMTRIISTKVSQMLTCLDVEEEINLQLLQSLCFTGIPEEISGLRALCWKILLGYIPLNINDWNEALAQHRENYQKFKEELIVKPFVKKKEIEKLQYEKIPSHPLAPVPQKKQRKNSQSSFEEEQEEIKLDHPLSQSKNSEWVQYFKDQELLEEIEKDVRRTRREQNFFYMPTDPNIKLDIPNIKEKLSQEEQATLYQEMVDKNARIEKHCDIMKTILFLYAKLNHAIRYVQGMNELLAPIYYCFASDTTSNQVHAESDAFFCFSNLMSELRDQFCRTLDSTDIGIKSKINEINQLLKVIDFET